MRIAHVVATFPPRIGGMGKVAYDECKKLSELGHEVTVFTLDYGDKNVATMPFQVVRLRPWIKGGDAGWVPGLHKQLKNFDVVHLHYPWYGGAEWVWLAKALNKQKYVVTYHMDAAPQKWYQKVVQAVYDTFLAGTILASAETVLVVDAEHFKRSRFGKVLSAKKLVELPNPIDTDKFCLSTPMVQTDKKNLLFVGNLLPVKRLDLLLTALARVPSDVVLKVVGGGYEEASLKNLAHQLKISDRVFFVGLVPPDKVIEYYRAAWCTVVPSAAESFSLVTLESLACGTPVIASDIPGVRGKINDGQDGFLFTANSIDGLTGAIQKIIQLTRAQRDDIGVKGRAKVVESYGVSEHMRRLVEVYEGAGN